MRLRKSKLGTCAMVLACGAITAQGCASIAGLGEIKGASDGGGQEDTSVEDSSGSSSGGSSSGSSSGSGGSSGGSSSGTGSSSGKSGSSSGSSSSGSSSGMKDSGGKDAPDDVFHPPDGGIFECYDAPKDYTVATDALETVLGDFTGDGKPDLAVVSYNGYVSILPATTAGAFGAAKTTTVTVDAGSLGMAGIGAGDFNGDGHLDVVTADYSGGTVTVLLGKGNGTFSPPTTLVAGLGAGSIEPVVADFNGDHKPDILVTGLVGAFIFLGKGNGTFDPGVSVSTEDMSRGTAADVNGDGHLDLVVRFVQPADAGTPYVLGVFLGKGDGTFKAPIETALTDETIIFDTVVVADFNGDGKLDAVISNYSASSIDIRLGKGDGTFGAPTNFPVPGKSLVINRGDFNGDGKLDLVVSSAVLLGNGKGGFSAPDPLSPTRDVGLTVADLNGDGYDDIVSVAQGTFAAVYLHCPHPEKDAGGDAKSD